MLVALEAQNLCKNFLPSATKLLRRVVPYLHVSDIMHGLVAHKFAARLVNKYFRHYMCTVGHYDMFNTLKSKTVQLITRLISLRDAASVLARVITDDRLGNLFANSD